MSVIVKGMEMPKNCRSCPLRYSSNGYAWCDITGESLALEIDMRDYTCPLVEVNETLFSADNARKFLRENPPKGE